MALKTLDIDVEITNLQVKMNAGDVAIVKTIKKLDSQKKSQQKLIDKHNQLQAAKKNITRFNKAKTWQFDHLPNIRCKGESKQRFGNCAVTEL